MSSANIISIIDIDVTDCAFAHGKGLAPCRGAEADTTKTADFDANAKRVCFFVCLIFLKGNFKVTVTIKKEALIKNNSVFGIKFHKRA